MTWFPVVERELRVAARGSGTYWGRTATATVALVLAAWWLWLESGGGRGRAVDGRAVFWLLGSLGMVYAWLAGLIHAADSISRERREGTLGLLFLTSLRGRDVVLGKLAASSMGAIYRVFALIPVMAIPLLMGGVSLGEFGRMSVVTVNALFVSLSAGMLASVIGSSPRRSAVWTAGMVFVVCFGGPMAAWMGEYVLGWSWLRRMEAMSPVMSLSVLDDQAYRSTGGGRGLPWLVPWQESLLGTGPAWFWFSVAWPNLAGWCALAVACHRLPALWREQGDSFGWVSGVGRIRGGQRDHRTQSVIRRRLDEDPFYWLGSRDDRPRRRLWAVLGVVGVLFLGAALRFGRNFWDVGTFVIVSVVLHEGIKLWIASEAPRRFFDDRRSGAMELYLTSDVSPEGIVRGHYRALRWQFLMPIVVILAADACFAVSSAGEPLLHDNGQTLPLWWLSRMLFLPLDGAALAWTGLWVGMTSRSGWTTLPTYLRVVAVPYLYPFAWVGLEVAGMLGGSSFEHLKAMWVVLVVAGDAFWIHYSRTRLLREFRSRAAGPWNAGSGGTHGGRLAPQPVAVPAGGASG